MDWMKFLTTRLGWLPPRAAAWLEGRLKRLPAVQKLIAAESDELLAGMESELKPYRGEFPAYARLPERGRPQGELLAELQALQAREQAQWAQGFVSGAVYHGGAEHIEFANQVYALHSQVNPLHADVWPSAAKFEAEIVAMTAEMLGARAAALPDEVCGTVTSGGTESILLAMKAYRDWGRAVKGIRRAEIVAPVTAHAAFDKAAEYFGMRLVKIPVDAEMRADVRAAERAIGRRTVVVVGSAPGFPHGVVDPIEQLSELARRRGVGFHTDACLGGFILPWARELGYPVPAFDFRLPGVTSISADTHKYGYAAKGTSVVLYRRRELLHHQVYATGDWPGGLYVTPTFAGSRPGALSAVCWATMVATGRAGYLEAARRILQTGERIKAGIRAIPELRLLGDPLWVLAFTSDEVNIYQVLAAMSARGWSLNGLFQPPAIHLALTLPHTQPGVDERFVADLQEAVAEARAHPDPGGGLAPVYGLAATMPLRGLVTDLLKRYVDVLYKV